MKQSIAIELNYTELCTVINYAKHQAETWSKIPDIADHHDKTVLEACKKIRKLIRANDSMEFILMDKPY